MQPHHLIDHAARYAEEARQGSLAAEHLLDDQVALISLAPLGQADIVSGKHVKRHTTRYRKSLSSRNLRPRKAHEKTALGARIKAALRGRSQVWLARAINKTESEISLWIKGKRVPEAENLEAIASATGCDLAWLLRGGYQVGDVPAQAVAEPPPAWMAIPPELDGDRRLEKAARELMEVLLHAEADDVAALLKNIEVFARDARARQEPKRRRRAG